MEFKYDKNRIWLANEDGDAIAFVDFPEFEPGKVEVTHTVVDPSLRGQGVAGKLMEALAIFLIEFLFFSFSIQQVKLCLFALEDIFKYFAGRLKKAYRIVGLL